MRLERKSKKKAKETTKREVQADPKLFCRKCSIQFSTITAWRRHVCDGHVVYEEEVPKKKKRPAHNYSKKALESAFYAVKNKEMGLRHACRFFKIPISTLQGRLKQNRLCSKRGSPPIFNEEEEGVLVNFVRNEGSLNPKTLLAEAAVLTKKTNKQKFFKMKGVPGLTWYASFVKRHPDLKEYMNKI